jgi:hypothetical protein
VEPGIHQVTVSQEIRINAGRRRAIVPIIQVKQIHPNSQNDREIPVKIDI